MLKNSESQPWHRTAICWPEPKIKIKTNSQQVAKGEQRSSPGGADRRSLAVTHKDHSPAILDRTLYSCKQKRIRPRAPNQTRTMDRLDWLTDDDGRSSLHVGRSVHNWWVPLYIARGLRVCALSRVPPPEAVGAAAAKFDNSLHGHVQRFFSSWNIKICEFSAGNCFFEPLQWLRIHVSKLLVLRSTGGVVKLGERKATPRCSMENFCRTVVALAFVAISAGAHFWI